MCWILTQTSLVIQFRFVCIYTFSWSKWHLWHYFLCSIFRSVSVSILQCHYYFIGRHLYISRSNACCANYAVCITLMCQMKRQFYWAVKEQAQVEVEAPVDVPVQVQVKLSMKAPNRWTMHSRSRMKMVMVVTHPFQVLIQTITDLWLDLKRLVPAKMRHHSKRHTWTYWTNS